MKFRLLASIVVLSAACNCAERQLPLEAGATTLIVGTVPPAAKGAVDLAPKALPRIAPGTVIGNGPPPPWSHLVIFATPGLGAGDIQDAPKVALDYTRMFKFTVLANVNKTPQGNYYLDVVGRGFAINIRGKETIVDSTRTFGADMGLFGKRILDENEKILDKQVLQVVRTDTMLIFDAQSMMLRGNQHVKMTIRHAILVSPQSGQLATLVWLLSNDRPDSYEAAETAMQLLPPNMHENRLLSVKKDKFFLGMPAPEAFALMRIPQGKAITYTPELRRLATVKNFTAQLAQDLETQLRAAVMTR